MTHRAPALAVVALLVVPFAARAEDAPRVIRLEAQHVQDAASEAKGAGGVERWPELRFAPDVPGASDGGEEAPVTPEQSSVIPEDVDHVLPETLDYWEQRQHLSEARIRPGQPVGGTALVGVRLASPQAAGRVTAVPGDPVTTALASWDGFGALVLEVVKGSPADDAGFQAGDIVVQYGGIWLDTRELLIQVASRSIVGREQEIWLLRDEVVLKTWLVPREREDVERP